ncbi:MAG: alpha-L-fucosidase [Candidatus Limimorpha sp.]
MKKVFSLFLLLFLGNVLFSQKVVEPTWESIIERGYPQWFSDAKLGIFIHWGVYSVPSFASKEGYAEWYYRGMMTQDSARMSFHNRVFGEGFDYRSFDNQFKAELWDPEQWAGIFKKSGAKYVLLVAKHHDGYCLWDSEYAPGWNSVEGGPKRNIVAELTEAVRSQGMKMGLYYSLPEWTSEIHTWCVDDPNTIGEYVDTHMIPQFKELVSTYKPSVVFTDGEWWNTAEQWHAAELISWYYNLVGDEAIVNDRWGSGANYGFRTPEYSSGIVNTDRPWAECRGLGRSFGLNRNEPLSNYLTSNELIRHFVQLVSAGGGMTLNVGPAADGTIPLLQQERLLDLGNWLEINAEAIYASRPYFIVDGDTKTPKFNEQKQVSIKRHDDAVDFNWVRNSPDKNISCDYFTAEWTGSFTPEYTDTYLFDVEVDDNVRLMIGDKVIVDYFKNAAEESQSNAEESVNHNVTNAGIKLKKGVTYPVRIFYQEKDVEAMIRVFVSSKKLERSVFIPDDGFEAEYSCMQPYVCYTVKDGCLYAIAIDYPQDELVLNIPEPSPESQVTMLGYEGSFPWKYVDGKMIIDTKQLKYNDLKSTAAWTFKISEP